MCYRIAAWSRQLASTVAAVSPHRLFRVAWPLLLLTACTVNAPHYGAFIRTSQPESGTFQQGQLPVALDPPTSSGCPVLPAGTAGRSNIDVGRDYTFAVVEFDDAGQFYNPMQLTCLMQELRREAAKQPLILSTYVPGWKSEDIPDAREVLGFRRVLHNISAHPREHPAPRVVGIYVGWRGKALTGSPDSFWQNISYFNRRTAARNIAEGEARTLFARLFLFRDEQSQRHLKMERTIRHPWVRMDLTGHSFGASIVFNALSAYAIRAAVDTRQVNGHYKLLFPSGTVSILINPAFSAAQYTALRNLAIQRCYSPYQKPVMLILSSQNDWPNKTYFPVGQMLKPTVTTPRQDNSVAAHEEQAAHNTAIGFYAPYINREIDYVDGPYLPSRPIALDAGDGQGAVKCPMPDDPALMRERPYLVPHGDWANVAHHWDIKHLRGDPLNPFWVATVDPRILNGHATSFAPPFTDLIGDLFQSLATYNKDELRYVLPASRRE